MRSERCDQLFLLFVFFRFNQLIIFFRPDALFGLTAPFRATEILQEPGLAFFHSGSTRRTFTDLVIKEELDLSAASRTGKITDDFLDLFPAEILARTLLKNHFKF